MVLSHALPDQIVHVLMFASYSLTSKSKHLETITHSPGLVARLALGTSPLITSQKEPGLTLGHAQTCSSALKIRTEVQQDSCLLFARSAGRGSQMSSLDLGSLESRRMTWVLTMGSLLILTTISAHGRHLYLVAGSQRKISTSPFTTRMAVIIGRTIMHNIQMAIPQLGTRLNCHSASAAVQVVVPPWNCVNFVDTANNRLLYLVPRFLPLCATLIRGYNLIASHCKQ